MQKAKRKKLFYILCSSLLAITINQAIADTQQELFAMNAVIGLNPLLARVRLNTNDIPFSIVTDDTGNILSIVMGDRNSRMNYSDFFGNKNGTYDIPVARFAINQLAKPIYITEKLMGKTANLGMIDGSKLNAEKGGELSIGIPESVISHEKLQMIELSLKKDPLSGKWAAYQKGKEDKAITGINVSGDRFGFSISSPQYVSSKTTGQRNPATVSEPLPEECRGMGVCLSYYKDDSLLLTKTYKQAEDFQKEPMFAIPIKGIAAASNK